MDETLIQNPLIFDGLYCDEESVSSDDEIVKNELFFHLGWEDELVSLMEKERETDFCFNGVICDGSLMVGRRMAVDWILRVNVHYGFSALTAVLAVSYFDRFISSLRFQRDKPWMSQLCAVACLSLAAKLEETQVPLLLDLQVEESKYVFEAKTIQRMELLVLSTLQWRMNLVTPISFFEHISRRLGLDTNLQWEFLPRCEHILLNVITDARLVCYPPSISATATMLLVIKEVEQCKRAEYQNQLKAVLKFDEAKVCECYQVMLELQSSHGHSNKRKQLTMPGSPNGVMDAYFSCDSSNDPWAFACSVSSSPEPPFKRSRSKDRQMCLPSLNPVSLDVLGSPR